MGSPTIQCPLYGKQILTPINVNSTKSESKVSDLNYNRTCTMTTSLTKENILLDLQFAEVNFAKQNTHGFISEQHDNAFFIALEDILIFNI